MPRQLVRIWGGVICCLSGDELPRGPTMPIALRFLLTLPMSLALAAALPAQPPPGNVSVSKGPAEIGGKTLDEWIRVLKDPKHPEHLDPSSKDAAIRVIPLFGNDAKKALPTLISMMVNEPDQTLKVSALIAVTSYPYDDPELIKKVVTNLETMLSSQQTAIRIQAALAAGRLGAHAKPITGSLIGALNYTGSYEVRRAAAVALGQVG